MVQVIHCRNLKLLFQFDIENNETNTMNLTEYYRKSTNSNNL